MRSSLSIALALLLFACSSPTIDGSSEATFEESVREITESLSGDEKEEFAAAMATIMMSAVFAPDNNQSEEAGLMDGLDQFSRQAETMPDRVRAKVHGMTAGEVIEEARQVHAEQEERARQQELREIQTLRERRAASESARLAMRDFLVTGARFYTERGYLGREPRIQMTMTNGTDMPISRAYFRGVVTTEGRSVSWIDEEFNYEIRGGIEPGESKSVTLTPNQFMGGWGTDVQGEPVFTVTVIRLDGPDGEPLFQDNFTDQDQKRLDDLIAKHQ